MPRSIRLLDKPGPRRAGDGTATANTFGWPRCKNCAGRAGEGAEEPGRQLPSIAAGGFRWVRAIFRHGQPAAPEQAPWRRRFGGGVQCAVWTGSRLGLSGSVTRSDWPSVRAGGCSGGKRLRSTRIGWPQAQRQVGRSVGAGVGAAVNLPKLRTLTGLFKIFWNKRK